MVSPIRSQTRFFILPAILSMRVFAIHGPNFHSISAKYVFNYPEDPLLSLGAALPLPVVLRPENSPLCVVVVVLVVSGNALSRQTTRRESGRRFARYTVLRHF
jgi:hypothetical protein